MMHIQYITTNTVLSPLLSQWVEQIFICQVKGHATAMAISKHMRYGPVMLREKHSILLHNAFFARHTVHIRPTSRETQTLLYANFKMKTKKNFSGTQYKFPHAFVMCCTDLQHIYPSPLRLRVSQQICQPQVYRYSV